MKLDEPTQINDILNIAKIDFNEIRAFCVEDDAGFLLINLLMGFNYCALTIEIYNILEYKEVIQEIKKLKLKYNIIFK